MCTWRSTITRAPAPATPGDDRRHAHDDDGCREPFIASHRFAAQRDTEHRPDHGSDEIVARSERRAGAGQTMYAVNAISVPKQTRTATLRSVAGAGQAARKAAVSASKASVSRRARLGTGLVEELAAVEIDARGLGHAADETVVLAVELVDVLPDHLVLVCRGHLERPPALRIRD